MRRADGVLVVGSGPGGAAAAAALAEAGAGVTLLEWGTAAPLRGTFLDMLRLAALPGRGAFVARDGTALFRGIGVGGTSLVNYATAVEPPLERFAMLGIDLAPRLAEVRGNVAASPLPDRLLGPAARRIEAAALGLGLPWQRLPKLIDPALCRPGCWRCSYGCPFGAKWSARTLVDRARAAGARIIDGCRVTRIRHGDARVAGVDFVRAGRLGRLDAATVILAAGGIGSPRLLAASGIAVPEGLFVDPVVALSAPVADLDGGAELPMAGGFRRPDDGVMFADMSLPPAVFNAFALQAGRFRLPFMRRRTLTLMVKIPDRRGGRIGPHWVDKPLAPAERDLMHRACGDAAALLRGAGARKVYASRPFAAHPGGSLAIGEMVDARLETAIRGLHVCDASVLPAPWGLPPTLTLLCLAGHLARCLAGK